MAARRGVADRLEVTSADRSGQHYRRAIMAGLVQRNGRRLLSGAVSVVIVVGVFWYFLPQYANISAVWGYISSMSWQSDAAIAIATVWNLCTYWFVNTSTMP